MHALAAFVNAVKAGRVPSGSFLVVESLDRLSREKIRPALTLLLNLIEAGVKVVQLIPVETVYDEDVEPMQLMMAVMELNRGHSESKVKSERVGAAWKRKRENAANKVVTRRLPGWVQLVDGELKLVPKRAEVVRRIFNLALAGNGVHVIAEQLNADKVPVMGRTMFKGRAIVWNETVVYHVLRSHATFGEFQPHKGRGSDRQPVGEPIEDYFPAVIDRDTFLRAQAALKSRTKSGSGRRGKHVNLFSGLLADARDGGSLTYKHVKNRASAIIPVGAKQGRGSVWTSFLAEPLERVIRSKLSEIHAEDIAGENKAAKRLEALGERKAELETLLKTWEAKMSNPLIADRVAANMAKWSEELNTVNAEMGELQREAANPVAEAWGEARTLAGMNPDNDTEELRVRIKAALRRCIESITCLFNTASRGVAKMTRRAAVRVQFTSGAHRDYLIELETRNGTRAKSTPPRVASANWPASGAELDLRNPKHAVIVERFLNNDKAVREFFELVAG
ncbi:MAG: recombinase family protein [Planctomycetia bacterium]|nr:recombinase family protein [Planctomycetia bacterium]